MSVSVLHLQYVGTEIEGLARELFQNADLPLLDWRAAFVSHRPTIPSLGTLAT